MKNLLLGMVAAASLCGGTAGAQQINATIPDVPVVSFPLNTNDRLSINCDMLEDPAGLVKAIVYSNDVLSITGPTSWTEFYFEDYLGNSFRMPVTLPRAAQADVALANEDDGMGGIRYSIVVVYSSDFTGANLNYLEIFDVTNLGTPGISAVPRMPPHRLGSRSNGFPHIDMWSDAHRPLGGYPSMHEFAVIWSENPTYNAVLYKADVAAAAAGTTTVLGTDAYMPDVACLTSNYPWGSEQEVVFTYGHSNLSGAQYDLSVSDYNFTNPGATPFPRILFTAPHLLDTRRPWYPRIEAMNQFLPNNEAIKWQVASCMGMGSGSPTEVWGYNNLNMTGTDMSTIVLSGGGVSIPYIPMAPCVAAGLGQSFNTNIGSTQYTLGFFPWTDNNAYTRDISAATGTIISPSNWYQVNQTPINYGWDVNMNLAVSNSSNSGRDILTAFHSGLTTGTLYYKYSPGNSMAFRTTGVKNPATHPATIYPNPASTRIFVPESKQTAYRITDNIGRTLQQGSCDINHPVSVEVLPAGNYLLTTTSDAGRTETYKFSKAH